MVASERRFLEQETTRYLINRANVDMFSLTAEEQDIVVRARNCEPLNVIYEGVPDEFFDKYQAVLQQSMAIFLTGQEMPHYLSGSYQ